MAARDEGRWCPLCGGQFRPGIEVCPECDLPLGDRRAEPGEVFPEEIALETVPVCPLCEREYEAGEGLCVDCSEPLEMRELPARGPLTGGRVSRDLLTRDPAREGERRRGGDLRAGVRHVLGDTAGGLPPGVDPAGDRAEADPTLGERTEILATFRTRSEAEGLAAALGRAGLDSIVLEEAFDDIPPEMRDDLEPHRVFVRPRDLPPALDVLEEEASRRPVTCRRCGAVMGSGAARCSSCGADAS